MVAHVGPVGDWHWRDFLVGVAVGGFGMFIVAFVDIGWLLAKIGFRGFRR